MIWLDAEMTSPYRMYQYWINSDDRDVIKFLKLFTFLELSAIGELEESLKQDPGKREPHRALAFEFTCLAHGENAARAARTASEILFGSEVREVSQEVLDALAAEVPCTRISKERLSAGVFLVDILVETKLAKSKRAARDLIGQGGAYLNNVARRESEAKIHLEQALSGKAVLLRAGKKNYHLLIVDHP
jgi:tyrosyl-tRNA synthetase